MVEYIWKKASDAVLNGVTMLQVIPERANEKVRFAMAHSRISPIRPILAAVRAVPIPSHPLQEVEPKPFRPFITISREPGAGAIGVSHSFVESINAQSPEEEQWACWDRELVDKVAADHHLSSQLISGLEEANHSWMTRFLSSLSFADSGNCYDEEKIYHRVKHTIEALANAGRVVIIGRGSVFITHHMPGGIHIRLVAPFESRVAYLAKELNLPKTIVAARVRETEKNRRIFFKMHWPDQALVPELFAVTINTAEVGGSSIVRIIRELVENKIAQLAG